MFRRASRSLDKKEFPIPFPKPLTGPNQPASGNLYFPNPYFTFAIAITNFEEFFK
jgi:hypothetical protein